MMHRGWVRGIVADVGRAPFVSPTPTGHAVLATTTRHGFGVDPNDGYSGFLTTQINSNTLRALRRRGLIESAWLRAALDPNVTPEMAGVFARVRPITRRRLLELTDRELVAWNSSWADIGPSPLGHLDIFLLAHPAAVIWSLTEAGRADAAEEALDRGEAVPITIHPHRWKR